MPLSKVKNRDRMRKARLHKQLSSLIESKSVQPNYDIYFSENITTLPRDDTRILIDADGNPIPELT